MRSVRQTLESLFLKVSESIRPTERLSVSEAAAKYRKLYNPGSYVGDWDNTFAPYLCEIMDTTTSLDFTGLAFVGPARCGKSDIFFNSLVHSVKCDPKDMMLIHMTQASARDWSQGDLQKVIRHNPIIQERLLPGKHNINVHDIKFINAMRLLIKYPTITELSGKTIPFLWLMDYDRMTQDVDGEGVPFDLARKRAQTFGRNGMCVAESSPGFEITNPKWLPTTLHEAPPAEGILSVYNRSDRRRWYWRCIDCGNAFEGDFKHFSWPDSKDHMEAAEMATLDCPVCSYSYTHDEGAGQPGKNGLNLEHSKWIKDGLIWMPDGSVVGKQVAFSDIAGFWLKGPAAAFTTWSNLVLKYLKAFEEYENTGSTKALMVTVNTDHGLPFTPPKQSGDLNPEELKGRAIELEEKAVPAWVRFLIATVDVQPSRFVVQIHGIGADSSITVIDRFDIKKSERFDAEGDRQLVNTASYLEDWDLLKAQVIEKSYPLSDNSGRHMRVKVTGNDSGGKDGTTSVAYNFWRVLRDDPERKNLHTRYQLLKGDPLESAPRARIGFPDSDRKDRHAGARGEIPVLMLNSNVIKDQLRGKFEITEGAGRIITPKWLPNWFYTELTVEVKTAKGWENPKRLRNESWDLLYYCIGIMLSKHVNIERINWEDPPSWAAEWDKNDLVFHPEGKRPFEIQEDDDVSLAELGEDLA